MISDPFELHAGAFTPADLRVVSFRGREALSELFSFQLVVQATPELEGRDAELLGSLAAFVLRDGRGAERRIEALVDQVRADAMFIARTGPTWHLRLVPPLVLLRRRTTSRIFQDETVPQILQHVLAEASIPVELRLSRTYAVRSYCVQYRESDLAFVRRLAAEEGIAFCFADAPPGTVGTRTPVIFLDDPAHYPPAFGIESGALVLRPEEGLMPTGREIISFGLQRSIRPSSVHLRDYDFRRPNLVLSERVGPTASGPPPLEVYQHHADYDTPDVTPDRARAFLEQAQRRAVVGSGESWVRELAPGRRFELNAEASPGIEGAYAVTRVIHEGHTPELSGRPAERTYRNRFECIPATALLRPRAPKRKPRQVLETAVVTGPAGHEVHTDEHARVKVQFHWDLAGQRNEKSSAWLRVAQSWAGASFGSQFVPRVGMEVLVGFLGGDTDCPVVLGCLYNATHPPPFQLPGEKLRSGLRTQSSPAATGSNELSFDDTAGDEQIYVHAQRDLDERIERRRTTLIGEDEQTDVRGNQHNHVAGERRERIGGSRRGSVGGDHEERVQGHQTVRVDRDQTNEIGGSRRLVVGGVSKEVFMDDAVTLCQDTYTLHVERQAAVTVGSRGDSSRSDFYVFGDHTTGAAGNLVLTASRSLTLQCGDSIIALTPEGVKIGGNVLALAGANGASIKGKGPALDLGEEAELVAKKIRIFSPNASLDLDDDAHLRGKLVKLNCDSADLLSSDENDEPPRTRPLRLKLSDVAMVPYAEKNYRLTVDSHVHEGTTGPNGELELEVPEAAKGAVLVVWIESYPEGPRQQWTLSLRESAPADSVPGAALRLRNLGYYEGPLRDDMAELPEGAVRGLKDFQRDHGVQVTGKLDAATVAKLRETYGH
ncbi:type VI secretion system tip protein TssI/VgrG [Sorangium sp. So ce128]|uniref:type VI secretion system tip protein TssI/VgrG n=1 Tax=Sorangium sp. So ce128 TaxID=3133281 RepID=UPI003F61ECE0